MAAKFQRQKIGIFDDDELDKKVWPNDCDNDRLPDITRLALKTSILPFPVVGHCRSHLNWWHFIRARNGRKSYVCRRNCNDICHSVGYVSTPGLDSHIRLSVNVGFICWHFLCGFTDCSYPGLFVPSMDYSYLGLFVPWTVRTLLDCSSRVRQV